MEWFMEWFIGWRMEWFMGTRSTDQYTEANYTSTKRKASDPFPKAPAWHKHKSGEENRNWVVWMCNCSMHCR